MAEPNLLDSRFLAVSSCALTAAMWCWQGREVGHAEPNSLDNYQLAVSQDSRFLAVASFTSDVKIWELRHSKDGFKGAAALVTFLRCVTTSGHQVTM